jgi:hypothetical protein
VRKLARLGEQRGVVAKKLRKTTPSRPSRSRFGVRAKGWPVRWSESQRWSSVMMKTMLGGRSARSAGGVSYEEERNGRLSLHAMVFSMTIYANG